MGRNHSLQTCYVHMFLIISHHVIHHSCSTVEDDMIRSDRITEITGFTLKQFFRFGRTETLFQLITPLTLISILRLSLSCERRAVCLVCWLSVTRKFREHLASDPQTL